MIHNIAGFKSLIKSVSSYPVHPSICFPYTTFGSCRCCSFSTFSTLHPNRYTGSRQAYGLHLVLCFGKVYWAAPVMLTHSIECHKRCPSLIKHSLLVSYRSATHWASLWPDCYPFPHTTYSVCFRYPNSNLMNENLLIAFIRYQFLCISIKHKILTTFQMYANNAQSILCVIILMKCKEKKKSNLFTILFN